MPHGYSFVGTVILSSPYDKIMLRRAADCIEIKIQILRCSYEVVYPDGFELVGKFYVNGLHNEIFRVSPPLDWVERKCHGKHTRTIDDEVIGIYL